MNNTTVIIGAGISGLLLARELAARGATVEVLEKSGGVGGRMSTKRVGEAVFDQGAQFFSVRDEQFSAMVEKWARCNAVSHWPHAPSQRWIAQPSMTGLAKALARGVSVRLRHKVRALHRHECGCWEIDVEGEGMLRAERLVLSSPVPQSLALLDAGGVKLDAAVRAGLEACDYHPCLALMLILDRASAVPDAGVELSEGPIRWISDNVKKGIVQGAPSAITVHLSRSFSDTHYAENETELFERILPALRPWLGDGLVTARALHRWRFSEPRTTHADNFVWLPEMRLGFCGDAFGGARVEGAAISGLALARVIGQTLQVR